MPARRRGAGPLASRTWQCACAAGIGMTIAPYVHRAVVTVKPLDSVRHARELLERHRINQLPVVVDGRVVGIVTDRDLRDAFPSLFDSARRVRRHPEIDPDRVPVRDVMSARVVTLPVDAAVAEAAAVLRHERIGAAPIVDAEQRLRGILTRSDLLQALTEVEEGARPDA
jgi:acetoin utilization protein AcuB